jgi:hypothetical protein
MADDHRLAQADAEVVGHGLAEPLAGEQERAQLRSGVEGGRLGHDRPTVYTESADCWDFEYLDFRETG